jgi:hypothetical protein
VKTTTISNASSRYVSFKKPLCMPCSVAFLLGVVGSNCVQAIEVDTGIPDVSVRWDNTFRYNLGMRMEGQNSDFSKSPFYDDTEHKFGRGDVVTNRVDIISELDVAWKQANGFRLSAAGWYDDAYKGSDSPNPDLTGSSNYINNHYNSYASRYIAGPSGEILDAFVFTGFQLGNVGVNIKAGQHNVYWGESLYSIGNSIAYSQGPVDTIKAATSPGAEAKELFLPLKQISTTVQLTDELSFAAQYLLDWKPFRLVPGGTYFSSADGARSDLGAPADIFQIPNGRDIEPDSHGDYGLNLRWSPWWLGGTAGVYYRKFAEKLPWSFTQVGVQQVAPGVFAGIPNAIRFNYARDTELYGLSLTKTLGTVSVASEVSYRRNTALNSVAGFTVISSGDAGYAQAEGARGDSLHALVNGIYLLPKTPIWDGGTFQAELAYNKLENITENADRFNGRGHGCVTAYSKNCADDHSLGMQMGFTPQWPQAFPGWDMSMPFSLAYGIDGNSPTLGGTNEGAYNYSVGINGVWKNQHNFTLAWIDSHADYKVNPASGYVTSDYTNGSAVQNNHGWLSFTYKTTY